jgi:tripartite-type tricarboxylate transporter receptor subunit TctC
MRTIGLGCLAAIAVVGLICAADGPLAQDVFPTRPVKVVIPYPAGGGTDLLGRLVADQLSKTWKQTVVVENIGGAAGNIGSAAVAKAAPDGYTLMVASPGPIATNAFLYKDMPYDPARWTPIALLATSPYVLVLRRSFEGASVSDLVKRAKSMPGKLTAATPGAGSVGHLSTVQLEMLSGIRTVHVPYRGLGPAVNDIVAGHVDLMFDMLATSLPLHRSGKVKIVGVGGTERVGNLPDVPTISEAGLRGFRSVTWFAMVAPPQMPDSLADRINRDVVGILGRKAVAERIRSIHMDPVRVTRAEAAKFFADERTLWGKVIKQAKIMPQ